MVALAKYRPFWKDPLKLHSYDPSGEQNREAIGAKELDILSEIVGLTDLRRSIEAPREFTPLLLKPRALLGEPSSLSPTALLGRLEPTEFGGTLLEVGSQRGCFLPIFFVVTAREVSRGYGSSDSPCRGSDGCPNRACCTIKGTPRAAPVKSTASVRAPVETSDSEARLRKLIAEVGLARSRAVLAQVGRGVRGLMVDASKCGDAHDADSCSRATPEVCVSSRPRRTLCKPHSDSQMRFRCAAKSRFRVARLDRPTQAGQEVPTGHCPIRHQYRPEAGPRILNNSHRQALSDS
jgi:hypothetical protein